MAILTVGERFPEFDLVALKGGDLHEVDATSPEDYFENVSLEKYEVSGRSFSSTRRTLRSSAQPRSQRSAS